MLPQKFRPKTTAQIIATCKYPDTTGKNRKNGEQKKLRAGPLIFDMPDFSVCAATMKWSSGLDGAFVARFAAASLGHIGALRVAGALH